MHCTKVWSIISWDVLPYVYCGTILYSLITTGFHVAVNWIQIFECLQVTIKVRIVFFHYMGIVQRADLVFVSQRGSMGVQPEHFAGIYIVILRLGLFSRELQPF